MKYGLLVGLMTLVLVGCGSSEEATQSTETAQIADTNTVQEKKATQDKTFGITPDEYGKRFVALAKEIGLGDMQWGGVDIQEGSVNDIFTMSLSDTIAKTGTVDKNGELKGITYIIGKTDDLEGDMMGMIMMAAITARVLSPELAAEETGGKLVPLMTKAMDEFKKNNDKGNAKLVVDGIQYSAMVSKAVGIWVSFEPAE